MSDDLNSTNAENSRPQTTKTLGYYNQLQMPLQLMITELGIRCVVEPQKYLRNRKNELVNDPALEAYVGPNKLAKAEDGKDHPIVWVPRPENRPPAAPNQFSFAGRSEFKVDDRGAVLNPPTSSDRPTQQEKAISARNISGMSVAEARAKGIIKGAAQSREDLTENKRLKDETTKYADILKQQREAAKPVPPPTVEPPPIPRPAITRQPWPKPPPQPAPPVDLPEELRAMQVAEIADLEGIDLPVNEDLGKLTADVMVKQNVAPAAVPRAPAALAQVITPADPPPSVIPGPPQKSPTEQPTPAKGLRLKRSYTRREKPGAHAPAVETTPADAVLPEPKL